MPIRMVMRLTPDVLRQFAVLFWWHGNKNFFGTLLNKKIRWKLQAATIGAKLRIESHGL